MRYSEFYKFLAEQNFTVSQEGPNRWNVLNQKGQVVATKKFRGAAQQAANQLQSKTASSDSDDESKKNKPDNSKQAKVEAKKLAKKAVYSFKTTTVGSAAALVFEIRDMQGSLEHVAYGYFLDGCKWGENSRLASRTFSNRLTKLVLNTVVGGAIGATTAKILAASRLLALVPGWGWLLSLVAAGFAGALYSLITQAFTKYNAVPAYIANKVIKPELFKFLELYAKQSKFCNENINEDEDFQKVLEDTTVSKDEVEKIGKEFAGKVLQSDKVPAEIKQNIKKKLK
jgi:hypothetical protein